MKIGRKTLPYGARIMKSGLWEVFNREYQRLFLIDLTEKQERTLRKHAVSDDGGMMHFYHVRPKPLAYGKFLYEVYDWVAAGGGAD